MPSSHPATPPFAEPPPPVFGAALIPPASTAAEAVAERRIATRGRTLRQHAARGATINGAFLVGLTSLGLIKGYVVAGLMTRADYGVWGILVVGLGTLGWLKGAGVSDKFVQQSERDERLAFQKAFTVEVIFTAALVVVAALCIPLLALIYGRMSLIAPAAVIVFAYIPTVALQSPRWIFYRRMDFVRQRTLEAVEPAVSVVVTIALAIAGAGYWSLVIGTVAGGLVGSLATLARLPFPLALRYERGTLHEYFHFTWPLTLAGLAGLLIAQGSLLVPNWVLGLSAVGVVTLASSISLYAQQLDQIVTETLYPAICAVRDRADLLFETFVKSNRVALMWGLPFGVGVALFASDLVRFLLGARWHSAIGLIQVFAIVAAIDQIGFNWSAFYRARGETRPILVSTVAVAATFLVTVVPLTSWRGLQGFGWSMFAMTAALLATRAYYLWRLFPGFNLARHMVRAVLPTIPATLLVLGLRAAETGHRGGGQAVAELTLYVLATVAGTMLFERRLVSEMRGYLARGRAGAPAVQAPATER